MSKHETKSYAIARYHGVDIHCLCHEQQHIHTLAMEIRPGLWMCPACHSQYTAKIEITVLPVPAPRKRKRKGVKRG